MKKRLLIGFVVLWSGCAVTQQPDEVEKPEHHTEAGFKNLYIEDSKKSFFDFLRMRFFGSDAWADHEALASEVPIQQVEIQALLSSAEIPQVTWLGHSTFLIQYKGMNVLTDPIFSDRASPLPFTGPKRYVPHVIDYRHLPKIDLVVISHNHYDHLDVTAINTLGNDTYFAVPLRIKDWLINQGINAEKISEFDWWQGKMIGGIEVRALPSQHWSARSLTDRFETLWASWSIKLDDFSIWFAGDTGYNPVQFKQIGKRSETFDLALIPIGAYSPRWFMQAYHVNPQEAVQIHLDVKARQSIGMHWGTYPLTAEAPMAPPEKLSGVLRNKGLSKSEFLTLKIGETMKINQLE